MRMDLVEPLEFELDDIRPKKDEIKEKSMAKVIEFYMPKHFKRPVQGAPQAQSARIIEFCSQTKQSA